VKGSRPLKRNEVEGLRGMFVGVMGCRNLAFFLLGANTGFRVSELLAVRICDILNDDGSIVDVLTVSKKNMKGNKSSRSVRLNAHAKKAIAPWLSMLSRLGHVQSSDPVFMSIRGDGAIGRIQAWRVLNKAYKLAGLTGKLGTHAMRKTFANNVYDHLLNRSAAGEPIDAFRVTSKALGHASIDSTDKYLSFRTEEIDSTIDAVGV